MVGRIESDFVAARGCVGLQWVGVMGGVSADYVVAMGRAGVVGGVSADFMVAMVWG